MMLSRTIAATSHFFATRRPAALAICLMAPIWLLANPAQAANCTAPIVDGELYSISNLGSGKVLDIVGGSVQAGANAQQWGYGGSTNQQFYARNMGNGYWRLEGKQSGMMLDVSGASLNDGAQVIQSSATTGLNQQWQLKLSTTGAYNVVARHSSKSLTVADSNSGTLAKQSTDAATNLQRWYFNPVSGVCGLPNGFAAQSGPDGLSTTTGGGAATPVPVSTCAELTTELQKSTPNVVHIPANTIIDCRLQQGRSVSACAEACPSHLDPGKWTYRLTGATQSCADVGIPSETRYAKTDNHININVASDKTLVGLNASSAILGASLTLTNSKNIILQNFKLENITPELVESGDGITLSNSSHIWIDHVKTSLISDGHIDITNSKNVTLSWNRFDGTNPAVCGSQHFYTNLVSNSQVTLHHNFWNKAGGRNPKLYESATRAHIYNNYWLDINYFAIDANLSAQGKIEGNYFANSAKPHWNHDGTGLLDANIASNRYTGISATDPEKDTGATVFGDVTMYPYTIDNVDNLPTQVGNGAGPR